jgi:hypothetical protein
MKVQAQGETMVSVYILMHAAMQSDNMSNMKSTSIDRAKTALVVIDLQKGVVGRQIAPHAAESVVKKGAALAAAFRKKECQLSWCGWHFLRTAKTCYVRPLTRHGQHKPRRQTGPTLFQSWDRNLVIL